MMTNSAWKPNSITSKRYNITRYYQTRSAYHHFDDFLMTESWQLEVYLFALGLMKKHCLQTVLDIGCGSGYKLVTYLGGYDTLGLELPLNVIRLREKYPNRKWHVSKLAEPRQHQADLIICSDVIEHLADPDELCEFIKEADYQFVLFSTPARNRVYRLWQKGYWGPPQNLAHMREWTEGEFRRYLGQHFRVIDQRITNLQQGTQMVICRPKSATDLNRSLF